MFSMCESLSSILHSTTPRNAIRTGSCAHPLSLFELSSHIKSQKFKNYRLSKILALSFTTVKSKRKMLQIHYSAASVSWKEVLGSQRFSALMRFYEWLFIFILQDIVLEGVQRRIIWGSFQGLFPEVLGGPCSVREWPIGAISLIPK